MDPFAASTLHLAAIVNSSDDAIVSKDLNGVVTSWNHAAERMFGYTAEEAVGRPVIELIIPAERVGEESFVLSQIRAGKAVNHFHTVRRRKDGTLLDISLTVSPIVAPDGTIVGASKIARDITEEKQLRDQLEEANRLKEEFLATLSHELRTPLNALLGYVHMMQSPMDEERRVRALEVVERNAKVLAQLVEDVLDTSRIATGKSRIDPKLTDASAALRAAIDVVRPAAEAKGITIVDDIEPSEAPLVADSDRLQQVFWNLLSNAVKFTPAGGRITAALRWSPRELEVTVSDTGMGIKPTFLPYVFQRFRQGDARTTREHQGLGLGLALVRHFVELHGGTVTAESKGPGTGATFRVQLPVRVTSGAYERG